MARFTGGSQRADEQAESTSLRPQISPLLASHLTPNSNDNTVQPVSPVIHVEGVGIHSGRRFSVKLKVPPQSAATFKSVIQFRTFFQGEQCAAPALWTRLSGTARSTALVLRGANRRKVELRTIEHFMAAATMSGLWDLDVEITALDEGGDYFEMPILDGSAHEWMTLLEPLVAFKRAARAGWAHLNGFEVWIVAENFRLGDGARSVEILPLSAEQRASQMRFEVEVDFGSRWQQKVEFCHDWLRPEEGQKNFLDLHAAARTFGFEHELVDLKSKGLALGGSLENALLLNQDRVLNPEGFRLPNELASHKLIDALGDLALLGAPVLGNIRFSRAGHSIHLQALKDAVDCGALVKAVLSESGSLLRKV